MTAKKKYFRSIICGLIIFIAGTFIAADWIVFYFCNIEHVQGTCGFEAYQCISKFSVTCLNAVLAWTICRDGIDRRDTFLLSLAFVFTVIADFFLKILVQFDSSRSTFYFDAGIFTFMLVQSIYIIRHSRNINASFIIDSIIQKKNIAVEVMQLAIVASIVGITIYFKTGITVLEVIIYAVFLITSVSFAWGTLRHSFFPRPNAWMIAIGMTLFFFCDVNVGISSLPDKPVANNLVWMFYTPALMLLALSGYKWGKD